MNGDGVEGDSAGRDGCLPFAYGKYRRPLAQISERTEHRGGRFSGQHVLSNHITTFNKHNPSTPLWSGEEGSKKGRTEMLAATSAHLFE